MMHSDVEARYVDLNASDGLAWIFVYDDDGADGHELDKFWRCVLTCTVPDIVHRLPYFLLKQRT